MTVDTQSASVAPAPTAIDARTLDDAAVVRATLAGDEPAWRELMRRFTPALRQAVRDAGDAIAEAGVDDVIGELWLSLVEQGMRRLRSFDPTRGASLVTWLTIRASQLAHDRGARRQTTQGAIPLEAASDPAGKAMPLPSGGSPTLLRVEEVAKRWGINRKTVYAMIDRGQISARRCGRLVRIPVKVIESFESQAGVAPERHLKCR